jgi:hypothetical protein
MVKAAKPKVDKKVVFMKALKAGVNKNKETTDVKSKVAKKAAYKKELICAICQEADYEEN